MDEPVDFLSEQDNLERDGKPITNFEIFSLSWTNATELVLKEYESRLQRLTLAATLWVLETFQLRLLIVVCMASKRFSRLSRRSITGSIAAMSHGGAVDTAICLTTYIMVQTLTFYTLGNLQVRVKNRSLVFMGIRHNIPQEVGRNIFTINLALIL